MRFVVGTEPVAGTPKSGLGPGWLTPVCSKKAGPHLRILLWPCFFLPSRHAAFTNRMKPEALCKLADDSVLFKNLFFQRWFLFCFVF